MYTYSYTTEVIRTILDTLDMFDIKYREYGKWRPWHYIVASFIGSFLIMPLVFIMITGDNDKWITVKRMAGFVLKREFDLSKEK